MLCLSGRYHYWSLRMPIHFVSGDLFANRYAVQAFAHGCNCQGSMGAGIAKEFRLAGNALRI